MGNLQYSKVSLVCDCTVTQYLIYRNFNSIINERSLLNYQQKTWVIHFRASETSARNLPSVAIFWPLIRRKKDSDVEVQWTWMGLSAPWFVSVSRWILASHETCRGTRASARKGMAQIMHVKGSIVSRKNLDCFCHATSIGQLFRKEKLTCVKQKVSASKNVGLFYFSIPSRTRIAHWVQLQVSMLWEHSPACEGKLCMIVYISTLVTAWMIHFQALRARKHLQSLGFTSACNIFSCLCAFKLITRMQSLFLKCKQT